MPQNTIKLTRNVLIMSKHLCTCQQAKLLVKMPGSIFCSIISHIRKTASINLPLSWMSSSFLPAYRAVNRTPASALSWRCLFAQSTHSSCDNEFCGCLRCVPDGSSATPAAVRIGQMPEIYELTLNMLNCYKNNENAFTFSIISWIWHDKSSWNLLWSNPTSCLNYTVNTTAADDLAPLGVRTSTGMILA